MGLAAAGARRHGRAAVNQDRNVFVSPNIADLHGPYNNRNRFDREVCGALELAFMRGEHSGYLEGYKDAKKGKRNKWDQRRGLRAGMGGQP